MNRKLGDKRFVLYILGWLNIISLFYLTKHLRFTLLIYREIMDRIRVGIYKSYSIKERNNLIEDFMSLIRGMYLKLSEVIYWVL